MPEPSRGKVLALTSIDLAASLERILSGAGCELLSVETVSDLTQHLSATRFDAVLLDLTALDPQPDVLSEIGLAITDSKGRDPSSRTFVLALTHAGEPFEPATLPVDRWIAAQHQDRALREVEGAIASRLLREALDEVDRLRRAILLARHTAHELAQPLTTVLTRAQLLLGKTQEDDPHRRPIAIICQEADRLAQIVERFSQLKVMAGPRPPSTG